MLSSSAFVNVSGDVPVTSALPEVPIIRKVVVPSPTTMIPKYVGPDRKMEPEMPAMDVAIAVAG